jgi:hypothetical protein
MLVIEIGWPIASLTTLRSPSLPCNSESCEYSNPEDPLPSEPTNPSSCDASVLRGYTRRIVGVPVIPSSFSAVTCAITLRACLAGSAGASSTNPVCSLSLLSSCVWVNPSSGASCCEACSGSLIRYGSAEISCAGSDTARSTPLRSVIVPR